MKFTVDRKILLSRLTGALSIIDSKQSMSMISSVKLSLEGTTVTMDAISSIGMGFRTEFQVVPIDLPIGEESTCINASNLAKLLTKFPSDQVTLNLLDNANGGQEVEITPENLARPKYKLKTLSASQFPEGDFNDFSKNLSFEFTSDVCQEIFKKISISISKATNSRNGHTGVFLDYSDDKNSLNIVSTDGRRLSLYKLGFTANTGAGFKIVIPNKTVEIIQTFSAKNSGSNRFYFDGKKLYMDMGEYVFSSSLMEQQGPPYEKVIPDTTNFSEISIPKKELSDALFRISSLLDKDNFGCSVRFENGNMIIESSETLGSAIEEIPLILPADITDVFKLSISYITDLISVYDGDNVCLFLKDKVTPLVGKNSGTGEYTYIFMPMA